MPHCILWDTGKLMPQCILLNTGKLMPQCICKTQAIAIAAWLWRWDFAQRKANNKRWLPKNGPRIVKATLKSNHSDYCGLLLSGQFYLNSVKRWSLPSRLFVRDSIYLQQMLRWNKQVSIVEYSTTEGQSDTSTALNYLARSEHVQPRAPGRGTPIWNRRGMLVGNFEFNPWRRPSGRGSGFLWLLKETNLGVA